MRKDKPRDIARGVLPSTARKGARDNKRNFHKKQRAAQREVIHGARQHLTFVDEAGRLAHDPDLYDDFEDRDIVDGYHAATKKDGSTWDDDMSYIVARRRDADNLGPLLSWARATERQKMNGWSNEDKYAYFKAVLPDTLQGRHALGHVETALDISNDEFLYGPRRYFYFKPTTFVEFRNALDRILATKAGRNNLREFLHEAIPVAAHRSPSGNKVRSSQPVVDENGNYRYNVIDGRSYRVTTDVFIPQMIATACDDCSFLRNDPLATSEAVARFAETVWNGRTRYNAVGRRLADQDNPHVFLNKIIDHVVSDG